MGMFCAAFIGRKHRAQARVTRAYNRQLALPSGTGRELPRECPREMIGHTACSERSVLLQSARENNTSRELFFTHPPRGLAQRGRTQGAGSLHCQSGLFSAYPSILEFGLLVDASQSAGESGRSANAGIGRGVKLARPSHFFTPQRHKKLAEAISRKPWTTVYSAERGSGLDYSGK